MQYWVMKNLTYINSATGKKENEKVYGGLLIKWLYHPFPLCRLMAFIMSWPLFSRLYGFYQNHHLSQTKIKPFIEKFSINIDEFLPSEGGTINEPYKNFNEFFTRKFRPKKREFCTAKNFPAPCEGRYLAFEHIHPTLTFPVKGCYLNYEILLGGHQKWSKIFSDGPLFIARLCPVDYHRFHFPDDGEYLDFYQIKGKLHSVNPVALKTKGDILITNERHVSILELKHFGKIAMIEVGATCVGKIQQLHSINKPFMRGAEKGMFLFGGSTVIAIGEPNGWSFHQQIITHTNNHIETYFKLGRSIGMKE